MILPFKTQFPDGTPTFFIQKIWESLFQGILVSCEIQQRGYIEAYINKFGQNWDGLGTCPVNPKHHTIRADPHDRWHEGSLIHPVVFNRSKNQFQFAPTLICKSTQQIEIINRETYKLVKVDANVLYESEPTGFSLDSRFKTLIRNDGFDTSDTKAFFAWFNHDFTGKIIHWTDLKY